MITDQRHRAYTRTQTQAHTYTHDESPPIRIINNNISNKNKYTRRPHENNKTSSYVTNLLTTTHDDVAQRTTQNQSTIFLELFVVATYLNALRIQTELTDLLS